MSNAIGRWAPPPKFVEVFLAQGLPAALVPLPLCLASAVPNSAVHSRHFSETVVPLIAWALTLVCARCNLIACAVLLFLPDASCIRDVAGVFVHDEYELRRPVPRFAKAERRHSQASASSRGGGRGWIERRIPCKANGGGTVLPAVPFTRTLRLMCLTIACSMRSCDAALLAMP
jgi:hypothetical protein